MNLCSTNRPQKSLKICDVKLVTLVPLKSDLDFGFKKTCPRHTCVGLVKIEMTKAPNLNSKFRINASDSANSIQERYKFSRLPRIQRNNLEASTDLNTGEQLWQSCYCT